MLQATTVCGQVCAGNADDVKRTNRFSGISKAKYHSPEKRLSSPGRDGCAVSPTSANKPNPGDSGVVVHLKHSHERFR